eukprot:Rhum_TRINITY_DN14733_c3_g1::Rhum_TRINITY_DN14733_c3_g1_i1::g.113007::m.113007
MSSSGVLNPAELHRECVRLEHQNHLLEKKLVSKDAELKSSFAAIQKLEQGKAQVKSDCDRLGKELSSKNKEVSEMHRTCQQLIQDREEWRGKEVALQRKLEAMHLRLREHEADGKEMQDAAARLQKTITGQDAQLQETLAAKQQLVQKLEQTIAAQGHELAAVREQTAGLVPSRPSPPAEDLDEQSQRLIAAESVASFGINEARAIKVECQQLTRKLARVEASNTRANEACAAYKSGCETLQEEIEHLAQEVSSARQEHQADRTQLLTQLRASEQRERDLHASMHAFRGRDVSVEEARQEVERLGSRDIEVLRTENHALKEEARELREASLGIREEIEEYQKRYLALMKTLQQVREQADDHRRLTSEDIQALNRENVDLFEDYSRVREERQQLRVQLTDAEKRLSDLREEKLTSRRSDSLPGTAAAAAARLLHPPFSHSHAPPAVSDTTTTGRLLDSAATHASTSWCPRTNDSYSTARVVAHSPPSRPPTPVGLSSITTSPATHATRSRPPSTPCRKLESSTSVAASAPRTPATTA